MTIMAGRMLMGILPAKNVIEEWRRLCAGLFLRDFSTLFLCLLLLCFFQLAERVEGSLTDLLRKREGVPTQQIDMIITQWGEAFNILCCDLHPSPSHLFQRSMHVQRIPEHHCVDDQPQRSKLLFLSLTIALAHLSLLSEIGGSCQAMATFAFVELDQDASPVRRVINIGEHYVEYKSPVHPFYRFRRTRSRGMTVFSP